MVYLIRTFLCSYVMIMLISVRFKYKFQKTLIQTWTNELNLSLMLRFNWLFVLFDVLLRYFSFSLYIYDFKKHIEFFNKRFYCMCFSLLSKFCAWGRVVDQ